MVNMDDWDQFAHAEKLVDIGESSWLMLTMVDSILLSKWPPLGSPQPWLRSISVPMKRTWSRPCQCEAQVSEVGRSARTLPSCGINDAQCLTVIYVNDIQL